jgi:hypothetical protein
MRALGILLPLSLIATAACSDSANHSTSAAATGASTSTSTSTTGAGGMGTGGMGTGGMTTGQGGAGGGVTSQLYEFDSPFMPGQSSVKYSGQSLRQVLIEELKSYLGKLTKQIDDGKYTPADVATTVKALNYYYAFDAQTSGADKPTITTTPPILQAKFDDIGKAQLKDKIPAKAATDHKDFTASFVGWSDAGIAANGGSITSPDGLVQAFFSTVGKLALDRANKQIPKEPGTTKEITSVYVTATGLDLRELTQKFLTMSVTYGRGTDEYLDDDVMGKGLLAPNSQSGSEPYTVLGHAWDEAFGYFGAARDYALYTDDEIAAKGGRADWQGYHDTNADMKIDLTKEYNWAASSNAAKRDLGSKDKTDFTGDAFQAFLAGRKLINAAGAMLSADDLAKLKAQRDKAVLAWEQAFAATVVHYINDTIKETKEIGTANYSFYDHAKGWSELKGFALGLQFNPRKKISDSQFVDLHKLLRDAPVLATATQNERDAYIADLIKARDILQAAYGFSKNNAEAW